MTEFSHYAIVAGIAWLVFYVLCRQQWFHRKIIEKLPRGRDIWREIILSMMTSIVYGLVALISLFAIRHHWTHLYNRIDQYGMAWFLISIVLTILLHDTYFYWTHRLMHHPRLYPYLHKAHHVSTNPTPWAAYAFDPWEALLQASIFPLVIFLYPIHPLAFLIFMIWQVVFNVLGHAGFEIYPSWFMHSWTGKFFNTPTNHTMHHQYFRGNYGLYFNFWDRWMGTNHALYEERFRQVTTRERGLPRRS
jgi:Delta7-sterol 5-desaturase